MVHSRLTSFGKKNEHFIVLCKQLDSFDVIRKVTSTPTFLAKLYTCSFVVHSTWQVPKIYFRRVFWSSVPVLVMLSILHVLPSPNCPGNLTAYSFYSLWKWNSFPIICHQVIGIYRFLKHNACLSWGQGRRIWGCIMKLNPVFLFCILGMGVGSFEK